jgi:hypothetical protein
MNDVGSDEIISKLNAEIERVIKQVAEQCEAGEIGAAYRDQALIRPKLGTLEVAAPISDKT